MTYDDNGNLTSITNSCGTTTYTWDAKNKLIGIEGFDENCNPLSASFKYDALGRRIEKTINGKTIQYLYDGLDIVQEIENGMVTVNYIRTLNIDEPLARIEADGTIRYYHADALGSVIALTDDLGNLRTQYNYSPFGETELIGDLSDNPFQYTGRENDNTGLYYYRFRYYSPILKRFISEDPIGLLGGDVNYYVYIWNNPLRWIDPWGLLGVDKTNQNAYWPGPFGGGTGIFNSAGYRKGLGVSLPGLKPIGANPWFPQRIFPIPQQWPPPNWPDFSPFPPPPPEVGPSSPTTTGCHSNK